MSIACQYKENWAKESGKLLLFARTLTQFFTIITNDCIVSNSSKGSYHEIVKRRNLWDRKVLRTWTSVIIT